MIARIIHRTMQLRAGWAVFAAHIMAGGQSFGAQIPREAEQVAEFQMLVAGDTRHWGLPGRIGIGKGLDHVAAKGLLGIDHVMSDAQPVRDVAGVMNVLPGAARPFAARRGTMIVELQRHADHLMARLMQQPGDHRTIHPAGHGNNHSHCRAPGLAILAGLGVAHAGGQAHHEPVERLAHDDLAAQA